MGHPSKTVKQEKEKEELAKTEVNVPGDEDMPMTTLVTRKEQKRSSPSRNHPRGNAMMMTMSVTRKGQKRSSPPRNHHHGNHPTNNLFRLENLFYFSFLTPKFFIVNDSVNLKLLSVF